jgi:serine/threonine protein kinase
VKVSKQPGTDPALTRRLDKIAHLLASTPDRAMASHFAIEVQKGMENGRAVYLTRRVKGPTLAAYFANPAHAERLPQQHLGPMLDELDRAVAWLHAHGFVHRDIRPDNVLVDPVRRKLVLVDFGRSCDAPQHMQDDNCAKLRVYVRRHLGEVTGEPEAEAEPRDELFLRDDSDCEDQRI